MDTKLNAAYLIDRLGGTFAVAKLCEVRPPSVSDWKKHGIPKARMMYLRLIRPDIFDPQPEPRENPYPTIQPKTGGRHEWNK